MHSSANHTMYFVASIQSLQISKMMMYLLGKTWTWQKQEHYHQHKHFPGENKSAENNAI